LFLQLNLIQMSKEKTKTSSEKKNNKHTYMFLFFLVCIILIISLVFILISTPPSETNDATDHREIILDESISPEGVKQAVALEIQRIHKKGIEQLIRTPGGSWNEPLQYHFEATLNDADWIGHNITTWDTGYVSWEVHRFVEDETETIPIIIDIYETQSRLFKTTQTRIEHISLSYNFRTGRWTGDDNQNDSDGYGHYNGDDYEIWFRLYQTDNDNDNIPYWTEIHILGTDPYKDDTNEDPDNDCIPTSWEWYWGYDPLTPDNHSLLDPDKDGLDNVEEYKVSKYLSNPFHKEIYIETDFMEKGPGLFAHDHIFWKESQWILMDTFSKHNITVHIDDGWPDGPVNGGGQSLPYVEEYIDPFSGRAGEYYKYYFSDERKGSFRYVFIHESGGWNFPQTHDLWADVISIPSNHEFYRSTFFPPAITPRLQRLAMAVAVTHELGHSLNLNPSYCQGIDNYSQVGRNNLPPLAKLQAKISARQYWMTYESVMNYQKFGGYVSDYSDGTHGTHDSNDWAQVDLTYFQRNFEEEYDIYNDT
jgi:hypothetical protein